ncbi:hypothetical protein AAMO2058_001423700 [Amorphochlora amoebiformis]
MASRALVRLFALNARLGLGLCPLPLASRGHLSLRGLSSTGGGLTAKGFSSTVGVNIEKAKSALKGADAVCFDVDSTVITEEGIDVLAASLSPDVGKKVAEFTANAMGGSMPFHVALANRLDIMKPSRKDIDDCLKNHPLKFSPGLEEFINALRNQGTVVYLVSGGFRQMIDPVAEILGVDTKTQVYANNILFDQAGEYKNFDEKEPTSRAGGKARVVGMLKETMKYKSIVMIGDGATDMEARPPADAFIGYGGIAVRAAVKEGADWFVTDFNDLINVVKSE